MFLPIFKNKTSQLPIIYRSWLIPTLPAVREVICKFIKATLSDAEMYESEARVPVAQVRNWMRAESGLDDRHQLIPKLEPEYFYFHNQSF